MGGGISKELNDQYNDDEYAKRYQLLLKNFNHEKAYIDKIYGQCDLYKFKLSERNFFIVELKESSSDEDDMNEKLKQTENKMKNSHINLLTIHMCRRAVSDGMCSGTQFKIYKVIDFIPNTLQDIITQRASKNDSNKFFTEEQMWDMIEQLSSGLSFLEGNHNHLRADTIYVVNQINGTQLYKVTYKGVIVNTSNYEDCMAGKTKGRYLSEVGLKSLQQKLDSTFCLEACKFAFGMILLSACLLQSLDICYDYNLCAINLLAVSDKLSSLMQSYSPDLVKIISKLIQEDQAFNWPQFDTDLSNLPYLNGRRVQHTYQSCPLHTIPLIQDAPKPSLPYTQLPQQDQQTLGILSLDTQQQQQQQQIQKQPTIGLNNQSSIFGGGQAAATSNLFSAQKSTTLGFQRSPVQMQFAGNNDVNLNQGFQNNIFEQQSGGTNLFSGTKNNNLLFGANPDQQNNSFPLLFGNATTNNTISQSNLLQNPINQPPILGGGSFGGNNLPMNQGGGVGGIGQKLNFGELGQGYSSNGFGQGFNSPDQTGLLGGGGNMQSMNDLLGGLNLSGISPQLTGLGGISNQINLAQLLNSNNFTNNNNIFGTNDNTATNSLFASALNINPFNNNNNNNLNNNQVVQQLLTLLSSPQQQPLQQQQQPPFLNIINENAQTIAEIPNNNQQIIHQNNLVSSRVTYSPHKDTTGFNSFNNGNPMERKSTANNSNNNVQDQEMSVSFNELKCIPRIHSNLTYPNGSHYVGQTVLEYRDGYGKLTFVNKGVFEGMWKMDRMHGQGTLFQPNGDIIYSGEWYMDQFNNLGHFKNVSAVKLEQQFDYHDFSELQNYWDTYEGDFCLDLKHGFGTLELTNGEKYVGNFRDDMVHGHGVFHQKNEVQVSGIWENNIFVKSD